MARAIAAAMARLQAITCSAQAAMSTRPLPSLRPREPRPTSVATCRAASRQWVADIGRLRIDASDQTTCGRFFCVRVWRLHEKGGRFTDRRVSLRDLFDGGSDRYRDCRSVHGYKLKC